MILFEEEVAVEPVSESQRLYKPTASMVSSSNIFHKCRQGGLSGCHCVYVILTKVHLVNEIHTLLLYNCDSHFPITEIFCSAFYRFFFHQRVTPFYLLGKCGHLIRRTC